MLVKHISDVGLLNEFLSALLWLLEGVEIIERSTKWKQRLILEAWHSVREVNSLNEHIAFPDTYKNLKNF